MSLRNSHANRYLDEPVQGLALLAKLIAMPPANKQEVALILEKLDKFIHDDFLRLCGEENLPNEAEMFGELKSAFENLENLTEFHALANKNVVAVGGGFSSGKSRFLNSILDDDILPTDTTPTTSIPTYISQGGAEEVICALNHFNQKVPIDREAVNAISHAFNKRYKGVSFSHIIKILTMEKPSFPYQNIAFLDTPGYSKSDSLVKGDNTDEQVAKEHLKMADHLVWLIDARNGTLPEADVDFIYSLALEQPLYVVINKADTQSPEEVPRIVANVRERLREAGIDFHGVTAYDSMESKVVAGDSLKDFLRATDVKIKHNLIKEEFAKVFEVFISYNHKEAVNNRDVLKFLNQFTLRSFDGLTGADNEKLKALIAKIQQQVKKMEGVVSQFEGLKRKVDETVDEILKKITVVGANKADRGVVGRGNVRDEKILARLEQDTYLDGKVFKIDTFGVFIDCGLGDNIMVNMADIKERHTQNPFSAATACSVQVIGIDRSKRTVTVVVCP